MLIPGPLQMLSAAPLAMLLRVNLPIALFTTLYTNPFTIVPLYALAYELGSWVTDTHNATLLTLPEFHFGLPLLATLPAVLGYFAVRVVWRVRVTLKWYARKRQ